MAISFFRGLLCAGLCAVLGAAVTSAAPPPRSSAPPAGPLDPVRRHILFLGEFENHAWGFRHEGWYIDTKGDVYTFRYVNGRPPQLQTPVRAAHIPAAVLARETRLIAPAAKGKLVRGPGANDAGIYAVSAFLWPVGAGSPKPVPLTVSGDSVGVNPAPVARALCKWLESIRPKPQ